MLALDCHPWNGDIGISALTATEVARDHSLADPAEMAAWRFFDFASDFECWQEVTEIVREMKTAYYSEDRLRVVETFIGACAEAITSDVVGAALEKFALAEGFTLSVVHPDTGREFVWARPT